MSIKNLLGKFEAQKAKISGRANKRQAIKLQKLRKKRIRLEGKAKLKELKDKENNRIGKARKKTSPFAGFGKTTKRKKSGFGSGVASRWASMSKEGGNDTPYWLRENDEKKKKKRGKTITIRL